MATLEEVVEQILAEISSEVSRTRRDGARGVSDVQESISDADAERIAAALVVRARDEADNDTLGAQLDALYGLIGYHEYDRKLLEPILDLDRERLNLTENEFLDGVVAYHAGGIDAYWDAQKKAYEKALAEEAAEGE